MRRQLVAGALTLLVVMFAPASSSEKVEKAEHAADRKAETIAIGDRAENGSARDIEELLVRIHDANSEVRGQAAWGLSRASAFAVPALVREFARLQGDEERARVAGLLGRVGFEAEIAIPELRAALADPDTLTAGGASYALGKLGAREAVPELVGAYIASRRIPNQKKMARALREIGSDQGARTSLAGLVTAVRTDLESDDENTYDAAVAYAESLYRAVRADGEDDFPMKSQLRVLVPALAAALDGDDERVVERAVKALALAGRDAASAMPALERLIGHPQLHAAAMGALTALGSREAEAFLADRRLLERLEKRVRTQFSARNDQGHTELLIFRVAGSARDGVRMSARFLYPGRAPKPPSHVVIDLESTSMESRFKGIEEITWIADGERVRMTGLEGAWSRSQIGGVIERISGTLPVAQFRVLATARELSTNAGGVEFALASEDLAALRHLAGKIPAPPAAPQ